LDDVDLGDLLWNAKGLSVFGFNSFVFCLLLLPLDWFPLSFPSPPSPHLNHPTLTTFLSSESRFEHLLYSLPPRLELGGPRTSVFLYKRPAPAAQRSIHCTCYPPPKPPIPGLRIHTCSLLSYLCFDCTGCSRCGWPSHVFLSLISCFSVSGRLSACARLTRPKHKCRTEPTKYSGLEGSQCSFLIGR